MFIEMACPACGRAFKVSKEHVGKRGKCQCGQAVLIEDLTSTAVSSVSRPVVAPDAGAVAGSITAVSSPTPSLLEKPKGFWATMKEAAAKAGEAASEAHRDNPVVYVSGPFELKSNSQGTLRLEDDRVLFKSAILRRELFAVSYNSITEAMVDTAERMTLMRVFALGIFAFGFKKKDRFLKMDFRDDTGLNVTVVFGKASFGPDMDTLVGRILKRRRVSVSSQLEEFQQVQAAVSSPVSPKEDIAGVLEKIAGLRDKGILTEEEFQAKKAEILSRL